MSQTSLTHSRSLGYFFIASILVSRIMGAINYSYNLTSKKFVLQNKYQHFYCAILHIFYISILPWALLSNYVKEGAFEQKPFYILLNATITILRLPALFLTLLGTWLGRRNMFEVIYRFEALRLKYFHLLNAAKREEILKHNDIMLLLKLFSSISLICSFYVRLLIFTEKPSKEFIFFTIYFGILEALTIIKMNFFYCGMCYANCVIRYIREELWQQRHHITVTRVRELLQMYMEVKSLVNEIHKIFQWELLSISLASMVALIALLFTFILRWHYTKAEEQDIWHMFTFIFGLNAAFVNIFDFLLIAFVCCNTIKCTRRIRDVLLGINVQKDLENPLELDKEVN